MHLISTWKTIFFIYFDPNNSWKTEPYFLPQNCPQLLQIGLTLTTPSWNHQGSWRQRRERIWQIAKWELYLFILSHRFSVKSNIFPTALMKQYSVGMASALIQQTSPSSLQPQKKFRWANMWVKPSNRISVTNLPDTHTGSQQLREWHWMSRRLTFDGF